MIPVRHAVIANLLLLAVAPHLHAQNRVLELDGNGSYVELPPNIFNDLDNGLVEEMAKREFGTNRRVFFAVARHRSWVYNFAINITETKKARLT